MKLEEKEVEVIEIKNVITLNEAEKNKYLSFIASTLKVDVTELTKIKLYSNKGSVIYDVEVV